MEGKSDYVFRYEDLHCGRLLVGERDFHIKSQGNILLEEEETEISRERFFFY